MKKYIIFAMRHISKHIVSFRKYLLTKIKGTVPHSYNCNVLDVCRNSRGLYPQFINITNLQMRQLVNKVNSTTLLITSQNYISVLFANWKKLAV